MLKHIQDIFNQTGPVAVKAIQNDIERVSATGKTKASVKYRTETKGTTDIFIIEGRDFINALETGRGPRKSNQESDFLENMLEYIKARGIGGDLDEKGRRRLARFLTLQINRHGDKTFQRGGRVVFSETVTKIVKELTDKLVKEESKFYFKEILFK